MIRIGGIAALILMLAAPVAVAQPSTPSFDQGGIVERVDRTGNVVVLQGGQMYRVTPGTVLYVNDQPVTISTLQPGQRVIVRHGQPVTFHNGQYVVVTPGSTTAVTPGSADVVPGATVTTSPGATVTTPGATVTGPGTTVMTPGAVATAPGNTVVVTSQPTAYKQTIYGRVSDVDDDEFEVRTERGTFEVRMPPGMKGQIREGDNVQLDLRVSPGHPAASPRLR